MHKYIYFMLPAVFFVVAQTTSYAQTRPRQTPNTPTTTRPTTPKPDLLVRLDGTQLEVLVTEITDKEIVYKRASNPNGPVFKVQKADFSFIKYGSNGEIERFAKVAQTVPALVQSAPSPIQARPTSNAPAPVYQSQPVAMSQGVRFGFKGGIQSASLSFSNINTANLTNKSILGFQAGLVLNFPLGSTTSLRSQLMYSGKGSRLAKGTVSINYIELPIDLLFKIPTSGGQVWLGGGGYLGYALGGKYGDTDAKFGNNPQTDDFTSTDFGLRFSGWYDLPSGLTLNVFYNLGLSNINPIIGTSQVTYKNKTLGLGIGYFLSR